MRHRLGRKKYPSYFWVAKLLKQMGHLTLDQRYEIQSCLARNMLQSKIAEQIGRHRSVISREIKRNSDNRSGAYRAKLAAAKTAQRHKDKPKKETFTLEIEQHVRTLLSDDFSPEQIVGRCAVENKPCVSVERIYQFVWRDKKRGGDLYKHLRTQGKRYAKRCSSKGSRGIIQGRVDIDQRPSIVDNKERFGDFEIDLVLGKNHKGALLTINDRATGLLLMSHVPNKQADQIEQSSIALLDNWKPFAKTITSDNGKEFANHREIAEHLEIDFYFAKPYHSWQRGANENLNGLVRQYFPKGMDIETITTDQINLAQFKLNNRPRKRFGYKTPNEMLSLKLDHLLDVAFIT